MSQIMSEGQIAAIKDFLRSCCDLAVAMTGQTSIANCLTRKFLVDNRSNFTGANFLKVNTGQSFTMKAPAPPPSPLVFLLLAALRSVAIFASTECDPTTPSVASLVSFTDDLRGAAAASKTVETINCTDPNVFDRPRQKVILLGIDGLRADAVGMLPLTNLNRLAMMGTSTVSK